MDRLFILIAVVVYIFVSWLSNRMVGRVRKTPRGRDSDASAAPRETSRARPSRREASRPESRQPKVDKPPSEPEGAKQAGTTRRRRPSESPAPGLLRELDARSLVRGVVMSEILGPPRSMKPYRPPRVGR